MHKIYTLWLQVFLSGHVSVPDLYLVARGFVSGHVYRIYTSWLQVYKREFVPDLYLVARDFVSGRLYRKYTL